MQATTNSSQPVSLLRGFVENIPVDGLGASQPWTWSPKIDVNEENLLACSPTTEYSSVEGDE